MAPHLVLVPSLMVLAQLLQGPMAVSALRAATPTFRRSAWRVARPRSFTSTQSPSALGATPAADLEPVPSTFVQCIGSAQRAASLAMEQGHRLLEVEFPPLAADILEAPECSAYDVSRANVKHALRFAERFAEEGKKVAITLPDNAEAERAIEMEGAERPYPNVEIRGLLGGAREAQSFDELFLSMFGKARGKIILDDSIDVYVLLVFSAQELPVVEELYNKVKSNATVVFFNLKLDTLRGDLGLPAFPPKDLQYRFLSQILPVYYLRTRQYSKSIAKPPYLINYQGALFRAFPGPYQSMLDVGDGRYKRVQASSRRPNLGEFKVQLGEALQLGDEGKVQSFFRQGYKTSTWWEEDDDKEESKVWRS